MCRWPVPETKVGTVLSNSKVGSFAPVGVVAVSVLSDGSTMFWSAAKASVTVPSRLSRLPPEAVTS